MLHAHLKLVPEDFFDVELSKDNFLVPCLSALLQVRCGGIGSIVGIFHVYGRLPSSSSLLLL